MHSTVTLQAPAKLNLFLEVLGRRADGFHEIVTIFQAINLHDTVVLMPGGRGLRLERDGIDVPCEPREDLAWRAALSYFERAGKSCDLCIRVTKRIPPGGGLGGGSSDAAAVLRGLDSLGKKPLGPSILNELAARLGSDVPFFLSGAMAIGRGRGEKISRVFHQPNLTFVLAVPPIHVPTALVYGNLRLTHNPLTVESTLWDLSQGKRPAGAITIHNRLEAVVLERVPALAGVKKRLEEAAGRRFFVTGSGSGLFALASGEEEGGRVRESVTDVFNGLLQVVTPDGRPLSSLETPRTDDS